MKDGHPVASGRTVAKAKTRAERVEPMGTVARFTGSRVRRAEEGGERWHLFQGISKGNPNGAKRPFAYELASVSVLPTIPLTRRHIIPAASSSLRF